MIKGGKNKGKGIKPDLNTRVAHLQELASTLNRSIKDEKKDEGGRIEEPNNGSGSGNGGGGGGAVKNNPDPVERKCCNCVIS